MPARLNIHYRDRSDLPMSDRDIWLDYKNAKNPRMQVRILAELNETKKQTIEEIINEQSAIEERKLTERKLILLKEVEQVKQTEEERKAKKAAYMKEYWARKKAEKASVVKAEEAEQEVVNMEEPKTQQDDSELIRKAIQYYSADMADAVMMQRERVEDEQEKLRQMEKDLKRCQEILGYEIEAKEGEGE